MHGLHRPGISYGAIIVPLAAIIFWERGTIDLPILGAIFLGMLAFIYLWFYLSTTPARRFLKGLRAGGLEARVADARVHWFGDVDWTVETAAGTWMLKTELSRHRLPLHVLAPEAVRATTLGWHFKRSGHEAAREALSGTEPFTARETRERARAERHAAVLKANRNVILAAVVLVPALGAALAVLRLSQGHPGDDALIQLGAWTAIGVTWFVAVVGTASAAWKAAPDRLGRTGGAALLLAGAAAGALAVVLLATAWAVLAGAPADLLLAQGVLAVASGLLAGLALALPRLVARFVVTLGAAVGAAAALGLPGAFFVLCSLAVLLLVLVLAWVPDGESELETVIDGMGSS